MTNERQKLERRLLGKLSRLGNKALDDPAVLQSVHLLSLELMETFVLRLIEKTSFPSPWSAESMHQVQDDLLSLIALTQEQGHSGLGIMAQRFQAHIHWMQVNGLQDPQDSELASKTAQDLMRMLHELAVGIIKPPNAQLLSALRSPNSL